MCVCVAVCDQICEKVLNMLLTKDIYSSSITAWRIALKMACVIDNKKH